MELPARRLILIETLRETLDCLVVKNRADTLNRISHRNPFLRSWIVNFVKAIATSRNSIHASHDAPHQSVLGYRENHILRTRRFIDASNIESRLCATDASGKPKWAVSPNFLHLAEIGTEEASYIWGDLHVHNSRLTR